MELVERLLNIRFGREAQKSNQILDLVASDVPNDGSFESPSHLQQTKKVTILPNITEDSHFKDIGIDELNKILKKRDEELENLEKDLEEKDKILNNCINKTTINTFELAALKEKLNLEIEERSEIYAIVKEYVSMLDQLGGDKSDSDQVSVVKVHYDNS